MRNFFEGSIEASLYEILEDSMEKFHEKLQEEDQIKKGLLKELQDKVMMEYRRNS